MSKSTAKKMREKMEREGKMNPELFRSPFSDINSFRMMGTKKTSTKKTTIEKVKYKQDFLDI
jgi:hypothetical protein